MRTTRIALSLIAALAGLGTIAQAADAAAEATPAADVKTAGYQLKNRSAFTRPETARSPFWPIGWVKPAPGAAPITEVNTPKVTLDPDQFAVTSILLGSPSIAIINGKSYAEGEWIRVAAPKAKAGAGDPRGGALPAGTRVRVAAIRDGQVYVELNGQMTPLPLRRAEVSVHKTEEDGADLLKPLSER